MPNAAGPIAVPTTGRIVHLLLPGKRHPQAAVVTHVYNYGGATDDMIECYALPPSSEGAPQYHTSIRHASRAAAGGPMWVWPPHTLLVLGTPEPAVETGA